MDSEMEGWEQVFEGGLEFEGNLVRKILTLLLCVWTDLCFQRLCVSESDKHSYSLNDALIVPGNLDALRSDNTCVFSPR